MFFWVVVLCSSEEYVIFTFKLKEKAKDESSKKQTSS
jgi:hypothetical protein